MGPFLGVVHLVKRVPPVNGHRHCGNGFNGCLEPVQQPVNALVLRGVLYFSHWATLGTPAGGRSGVWYPVASIPQSAEWTTKIVGFHSRPRRSSGIVSGARTAARC